MELPSTYSHAYTVLSCGAVTKWYPHTTSFTRKTNELANMLLYLKAKGTPEVQLDWSSGLGAAVELHYIIHLVTWDVNIFHSPWDLGCTLMLCISLNTWVGQLFNIAISLCHSDRFVTFFDLLQYREQRHFTTHIHTVQIGHLCTSFDPSCCLMLYPK